MNQNKSILRIKSFAFAASIIKIYKHLLGKNEYVLSKQLLRSGTAIGAMIREAQNAESSKDFIHKLGIAQKECDETLYWLEPLLEAQYIENDRYSSAYSDAEELLKIIKSSILTMKSKLSNS